MRWFYVYTRDKLGGLPDVAMRVYPGFFFSKRMVESKEMRVRTVYPIMALSLYVVMELSS